MINSLLLSGVLLFLLYALYDQFGMDRLKGKTRLKVRLKKQAKSDTLIFIALLIMTLYQSYTQLHRLEQLTLFLIATVVILAVYAAFIRSPQLLLKAHGFFYGNIYFDYAKIHQINLAEGNIIVIDLKSGRRLLIMPENQKDTEQIIAFFGGYKDNTNQ